MPQMAPYSWLMLMLMFSFIFLISNSIIHFNQPMFIWKSSKFPMKIKFIIKW